MKCLQYSVSVIHLLMIADSRKTMVHQCLNHTVCISFFSVYLYRAATVETKQESEGE